MADRYVPATQFARPARHPTGARSVTARVFTRSEQADDHCQVGNIALSLRMMLDWLDGLHRRDTHRNPSARLDSSAPAQAPAMVAAGGRTDP